MKLLFLDVDGVLNNCEWFRGRPERMKQHPEWSYEQHQIDPENIKNLCRIIEETGCEVVISSTWRRYLSMGAILRLFVQQGMDKKYWDSFIGVTPVLDKERGLEIQDWIDKHPYSKPDKFVILDDDLDMAHLMSHAVGCNAIEGLTEEKAQEAIKRLNS